MGERRKRKSMWHMEDENRPHPGDHNSLPGKERLSINNRGRGHEFMEPKSGDRLGHPSRELNKESTYYQNMSPGFDGIEQRKYKPYPEDDRSNSHRYRRKDRSRSRSRSKNSRDRVRSGSPRQDHKNQSHKCSDQRSEPDKQFKICHDFFAGRCRKGSQCRLDHSRNTSHGHSFTDSYSKVTGSDLPDDVPSYNHGEEAQLWKKSRNAVACSEFVKGWCKWGDSCRFSHHRASNGTDNTNNLGDNTNSRCDSKSSLHMENEDASWRTQEFGDIVLIGSNDKENMANKQENNTMSHRFPPPIEVRNVSVQEQHTLLDHRVVENRIVTSFGSDVLDDFKNSSNTTYPFSFPRQNQSSENELIPGQLSVSNATDVWRNMLSGGVDGLETQAGAQLDLHSHVLNHQLETQSSACLDLHSQVKNHQLEGDCLDLHSQVKNPQLETQSGDHLDLQPQVPNHQRAVQILKGLLESKVTFPIGFPQEPINAVENGPVTSEDGNYAEQYNQVQVKTSPIPTIDRGPDNPKVDVSENSKQKQEAQLTDPEAGESNKAVDKESKAVENQKSEENVASKDEKAMRLFKNSLIEFVKDILKPTWKEGKLSREVHKTIVKKVVDKVTGTVQPDHVPKTQDKVDQYLSLSKPRISKLVQAYVERSQKTNS